MRFNKIYVEITNYCNLRCSFCSIDNRLKKEMSVEEFKIVIDKIKNYTNNIYLHVKGEPLLHSKLDEILEICDKNSMNVRITTNGTLLKKQIDTLMKHNIKQINISLHSENKKDDYFDSIFEVVELLRKRMPVVYRTWIQNDCSNISIEKIIAYYHLPLSFFNDVLLKNNVKIKENLYLDKDKEFIWPNDGNIDDKSGYCLGTKTHIAILSNGEIVPCCLDSDGIINLGNIYKDDLKDVLNSDLFKKINDGFKKRVLVCDLCRKCNFRRRFDVKNS